MNATKYIFTTKIEVRDYECDIEGIVNNARYLHYTEHTRHRFMKQEGLSFAEMHNRGIDAVVRMGLVKQGLRYIFIHDLYRESDNRLCFHCEATLVCLINGHLGNCEEYDRAFAKYLNDD